MDKLLKFALLVSPVLLPLPAVASQLETVTVTGKRLAASRQSLATNTAVVDQQSLTITGHAHINEALARVPGAWISRGNGQEHLTAIRSPVLTGAGSCGAFLMAEDGVPLRAPGFCNANQLFEVNSEQAQRIEVLRGPGSALYGSNAEHGIINVITPDPDSDAVTALGLEGGANDYWRGRVKSSRQIGDHGWLVYANGASDNGYKKDSGFDQQKINLVHRYSGDELTVKSVLSATNLNQETAGFIEGRNAYKDSARKRENPNPEAFRDAQALRLYSRATLQLDSDDTLSLTPYLRYTDMEFLQHFLPWQPLEENGQRGAGMQLLFTRDRAAWRASIGLDVDYTEGFLKETQELPFSPSIPAGAHYDYEVDASVLAPFFETEWQLSAATRLNLGLRFEHTRYAYDNALSAGSACAAGVTDCRFTRPADRNDRFAEWAPRLGLLQQWSSQHASYLQLARGYRAPQATELYRLQAGQLRSDIKPEELDSIEIGFRGNSDRLFYDLAAFGMRKNNFIFQDTERQNISDGKTEHYGVELDLRLDLPAGLDLSLNGTWARHRYANAINLRPVNIKGNDIDTAPRHIGSARIGWSSSDGHRAELEWVHMGAYYQNPENSARYPGHDLLHARLIFDFRSNWQLAVRVNNLTDEDYAERADFAFGDDRYFVGEPRAVFLSISAELGG